MKTLGGIEWFSRLIEEKKKARRGDVFCRYAARDGKERAWKCRGNQNHSRIPTDAVWASVHFSSSCDHPLFARLISACRSYVILHSPWSLPPSHSSIRHLPWIKMLFFFQACRRGITLRSDREIGGGLKISKNRRQNVETVEFIRIYIYIK